MDNKKWYQKDLDLIIRDYDVENGLDDEQVLFNREKYGVNKLDEGKKDSLIILFLKQFNNTMIIILIIASIVSFFLDEKADAIIILAIVVLNAVLGVLQEDKAERALAALKELAAPLTKVIRNGQEQQIDSKNVVMFDLVVLDTGDQVSADLRLIKTSSCQIQEASLTGESVPVEKDANLKIIEDVSLGDRKNMVFASSSVTYGRALGLVVGVGMNTEVGKIANLLTSNKKEKTPLEKKLDELGRILGIGALISVIIIFGIGVLNGKELLELFMSSVSLAVAVIPESLPAVATIVMAMGVQRLAKRNAIIRNLSSVETLGGATVICSDKTGTLTQNKMTVTQYWLVNEENHQDLLKAASLCNDSRFIENKWVGDPTETALSEWAIKQGLNLEHTQKLYPRVAEVPFESIRKRMATVHKHHDYFTVFVKGGVDEVLSQVTHRMDGEAIRPITPEDINQIQHINAEMGKSALRVLAYAKKILQENIKDGDISVESQLCFIGLTGMIDPPREEVKQAIEECRSAGIRPIMITGDHKITAEAIGLQIGLMLPGDKVISGIELDLMSDDDLFNQVRSIAVYARVSPEHKMRIIDAWKKQGEMVAMTGDGVNDAPALKKSDIGAAMGLVGTEVAKGAADMVLADDNFATVVNAVEEGRRIRDNITKAITYLLSCNVGELFTLLVAALMNWATPLLPIHILWINLVTDSLPALALGIDPAEDGIMHREPNREKGLLNKSMAYRVAYQGILIGILTLIAFLYGYGSFGHEGTLAQGQTMAFIVLAFSQLVHAYNIHSYKQSAFKSIFKNRWLVLATITNTLMMLAVLFIPQVRDLFKLVRLDFQHWEVVILLMFIPLIVVEIMKLLNLNGKR